MSIDTSVFYSFIELSKDLNMNRTAERLYVSQQTLSARIIKLENELGCKLFYRKPHLALTPAGEFVLEFSKEYEKNYQRLTDVLSDYSNEKKGVISFGASTLRLDTCLPAILPKFYEKYPNVDIRITDNISSALSPLVSTGELDLALVSTDRDDPSIVEEKILDDEIFLCVSDVLLELYYGEYARKKKAEAYVSGADIMDFIDLPYYLSDNKLGQMVLEEISARNLDLKKTITGTYIGLGTNLCFEGICATFATRVSLTYKRHEMPDSINVFKINAGRDPFATSLRVIYNRNRYLPSYTKYFLELIKDYFSRLENVDLRRLGMKI